MKKLRMVEEAGGTETRVQRCGWKASKQTELNGDRGVTDMEKKKGGGKEESRGRGADTAGSEFIFALIFLIY